jgi:hypothetical protein
MFTIRGREVEPRREFTEKHALKVKFSLSQKANREWES